MSNGRNPVELVEFHKWADQNALSYTLSYWEASGEWEVRIHSAAKDEEYYEKRVYYLPMFMENWAKHLKAQLAKPS